MKTSLPKISVAIASAAVVGVLLLIPRATSEFLVILAGVVLVGLGISAGLDLYAMMSGRETVGDGIRRTTRRFGLYRTGLSLFLGALLGHFFWPSP